MSDTLRTPQEVREAALRIVKDMRAESDLLPTVNVALDFLHGALAALVVETTPRKEKALGWRGSEAIRLTVRSVQQRMAGCDAPECVACAENRLAIEHLCDTVAAVVASPCPYIVTDREGTSHCSLAASPPDEGTPHETALANEWRGEVLRVVRDLEATYREQHVMAPIAHRALREVAQKIEALPLLNAVQRPAAETTSEDTDEDEGESERLALLTRMARLGIGVVTFGLSEDGDIVLDNALRAARAVPAPETPENR